MRTLLITLATLMLCSAAWGQAQSNSSGSTDSSMPGMDMSAPHHDMSNMKDAPKTADKEDSEAGAHVMHAMEGHMDMGPHMKMTELRQSHPGDADRAQKVVEAARKAAEKYEDYHVALAEGFKIFLPNVPQKMYHFTNYGYAMEAAFYFNPNIRHRSCMKSTGKITN